MNTRKIIREIISWLAVFLLPTLVIFTLLTSVFAVATVEQQSMENTLMPGSVLYCVRRDFTVQPPVRGDVVVFFGDNREKGDFLHEFGNRFVDLMDRFRPMEEKQNIRYIKRVIGLPGDTMDIQDGHIVLNGKALNEPYALTATDPGTQPLPLTVPAGELFLAGDNRGVSMDSRELGCIKIKAIEGIATFRIWPTTGPAPFPNKAALDVAGGISGK